MNYCEELWIRNDQQFFNEKKNDQLRIKLHLFKDDKDVLRSDIRLSEARGLAYDQRHWIVLHGDSDLAKFMVYHHHEKMLHAGVESTQNSIRTRF